MPPPLLMGALSIEHTSRDSIHEELGWTPRYRYLATIIAHAWAWRQAHPERYR
jgi:UDP-glucose 4-epimerase